MRTTYRQHGRENERRKGRTGERVAAAGLACMMMTAGVHAEEAVMLGEPEYPVQAEYPDFSESYSQEKYDAWWEQNSERLEKAEGLSQQLREFTVSSMRTFLVNEKEDVADNVVYSPVNVWMALALLAECTGSDTQAEILDTLGADSIEALRESAARLWEASYCDDGHLTRLLGNSAWLDQNLVYNPEILNTLTETYYASVFQGEMGSDAMNQMLQKWLDEQTGGLLSEQARGVETSPETVLALASSIYFKSRWASVFSPELTYEEIFYGPDGEISCDFMHSSENGAYYRGEHFGAVSLGFDDRQGSEMWLILPDEDSSVQEVLAGDDYYDLILGGRNHWENKSYQIVDLSLPKFDVCSDLELSEGLQELGIRHAFDDMTSDYSPLITEPEHLMLSSVKHAARVKIDEEGCEAAAYTVELVCGTGMPPQERIDFVVNRPFLFAITGPQSLPMFTGVVCSPAE